MGNEKSYQRLLEGNKEWSKAKLLTDPEFLII